MYFKRKRGFVIVAGKNSTVMGKSAPIGVPQPRGVGKGWSDGKFGTVPAESVPMSPMETKNNASAAASGTSAPSMIHGGAVIPPNGIPKALTIPKTSVAAALLGTPKKFNDGETPRSSLDLYETSSVPTPRASLSVDEGTNGVADPASPRTPGGRKKKNNKIHGLDYYEFCELVRAGNL